jgi:hypothetical protein
MNLARGTRSGALEPAHSRAADAVAAPPFPGRFTGAAAPSPALVAVLASRLAANLFMRDGRVAIHVADSHRDDAVTRRLGDESGIIMLPCQQPSN